MTSSRIPIALWDACWRGQAPRDSATCVLNSKLGVFFVVFLPQFIPPGTPVARTSLALAGLQAAEAVLWYLLLSRLAGTAGPMLARRQVRAWLDRVTATVFVGFAIRLAADSRP